MFVFLRSHRLFLILYKKYRRKTVWRSKDLESFYNDLESQHIFGVWNIDKEKLKNDLLSCKGENTFQNLIKILYLNFNSIYSKNEIKIIGDKNPIYSVNFPEVFPIFENAKYIHLTRDYRDQIVSMKKMDFEMSHPALVAYRWRLSMKQIQKFRQKFPDKFYSLKYEDLVSEPKQILEQLCDFLGVEFAEQMLEFHSKDAGKDFLPEAAMNKYHSSLFNPLTTSKVKTWETKLNKKEIIIADMVVGSSAELAGYKRKYDQYGIGLRISALPILMYGILWNTIRQLINMLPFRIKMVMKNKGHVLPGIYKMMKRVDK